MSVPAISPRQRPGSLSIDWGRASAVRYGIAEVVALTGVPASSIHHYLRLGLIPPPDRTATNRFAYDDRHVVAVGLIRRMRQRGHTLDEVHHALPELWGEGGCRDTAVDDFLARQQSPRGARTRLIDAAIEAFAQQGYGEVTIASVCSRAQVAKGTFYRHFENKDELFVATAGTIIDRAVAGFAADVAAGATTNTAAGFAAHLRSGLPVLFELAKCSTQESGPNAQVAVSLFVDLVERLGQVIAADASASVQAQQGGAVVMFAVVEIFARLLDNGLAHAPRPPAAESIPKHL